MVGEDEALSAFPAAEVVRSHQRGKARTEEELRALLKPLEDLYATLLEAVQVTSSPPRPSLHTPLDYLILVMTCGSPDPCDDVWIP